MKVLLHICCGPCAIGPVTSLRQEGHDVEGFFYNPNIHPYSEYLKRYAAAVSAAQRLEMNVIHHRYDFERFLAEVGRLQGRGDHHRFCWRIRLEETARVARQAGCDAFTTTLLSSPYQDVDEIGRIGEGLAGKSGLVFLRRNFRSTFARSHQQSREWGLYHQNYCGCVYSEKESIEQREKKKRVSQGPS